MELKILEEFGLTKNEIDIFLVLVKKGTLSPTQIAKETGLNRPYVYYALERLLEKGYLSEIRIKGKKNFKAIELSQIAALEEHKLGAFKNLITELQEIKQKPEGEIEVEVLKGKYVVKNIFKKLLSEIRPNQTILYLGLDEEKMEAMEPVYIRKLLSFFKKKRIKERIIIKKGGKKLAYAKTAAYHSLESGLIGNTSKFIYQDIVIDLLYGTPTYAIIIKNKNLADIARKQFEVFWKISAKT